MKHRIETDSMGKINVPSDKFWGAQTQRSLQNFKIGKEIFPREFIKSYGIIKYVAAEVNAEYNLLEKKSKDVIQSTANEIINGKWDDQFPLVIWQTGSGTQTNMNFNEVIANLANIKLGGEPGKNHPIHPNDHVNRSQSTNDTFPTAINISSATQVSKHLIPALEKLRNVLNKKSEEFSKVIKLGRTHLQDATPLTLGQEFSGYARQIENCIQGINSSIRFLYELAIGGTAVGTGLNAPEGFAERCASKISKITGLPFISAINKFEALGAHDSVIHMSGSLKVLGVALNKIANDIRWLASGPRAGLGEIILPSNEPGSSIMPGKVNPTQCEAVTMVVAQVIGNDTTLNISGASGNFELNVYRPVIAFNILQSIQILGDVCNSFSDNCIVGITPNFETISKNLNNSLMLVTALTPHIGYDKAAEAAKKAHIENTSLKTAVISLGYISKESYEDIVNPENMI